MRSRNRPQHREQGRTCEPSRSFLQAVSTPVAIQQSRTDSADRVNFRGQPSRVMNNDHGMHTNYHAR